MPCYHPIPAYLTPHGVVFTARKGDDVLNKIHLPCGVCIGCRLKRASDWELRIMHEAQQYEENSFVTLTYKRDALPPNASLCHDDYQRFMKRLRKRTGTPVRFYMCGEYGPTTERPHYHACLFNVAFADQKPAGKSESGELFYESETLNKIWGHGKTTVQPLNNKTASYCARYIMTKKLGKENNYDKITEEGEIQERRAEYAAMSLKPGIGHEWIKKYRKDVYTHDYVITKGEQRRPPKYYDKIQEKHHPERMEEIKEKRLKDAKKGHEDQTDERLAVRKQVTLARIQTLKRNLES
ncbi:MAG: replication initiator protein [Microvirus sp.]|nr:MAG: replication initiator protein [Microvirus sp.]